MPRPASLTASPGSERRVCTRPGLLLAILICLAFGLLSQARAAVKRTVTTLGDSVNANDGKLSLREAIAASAAGDSIDFAVTGTSLLASELVLARPLTISGPGARNLALDGNYACRIFNVQGAGVVTIVGLTLTRGRAPDETLGADPTALGGLARGGAVLNTAQLVLKSCAVTHSTALSNGRRVGGHGFGGGISSEAGSLTLRDCVVSDNVAYGDPGSSQAGSASGQGGGVFCFGPATLINTSVANNRCDSYSGTAFGAGISFETSQSSPATQILVACTVVGNHANSAEQSGIGAGGVDMGVGQVYLRDTLVARNAGALHAPDLKGDQISLGHNLIGTVEGSLGAWQPTDLTGSASGLLDPQVSPLQNNGGSTDSVALLSTSAALDAGDDYVQSAYKLPSDQRGFTRLIGTHVDIGVYERGLAQGGPTFTVTTLEDSVDPIAGVTHCSLREALQVANGGADTNTVRFAAGLAGTIFLDPSFGSLVLSGPVTLSGPGARTLAVSGGSLVRVFDVTSSSAVILGLTIRDGFVVGHYVPGGASGDEAGGGVRNTGNLTLRGCSILYNRVFGGTTDAQVQFGGSASGGGVSSLGNLAMVGCTVAFNQAVGGTKTGVNGEGGYGIGGGVYAGHGTLSLTNCTVSSNLATGGSGPGSAGETDGGGIVAEFCPISLLNCTVSGNVAGGNAGLGGGLLATNYTHIRNSLVAGNSASTDPDAYGSWKSDGNNLIGKTGASTGWVSSDRTGTAATPLDPKLSRLADNGGPIDTMALLSGSPAIDTANTAAAPPTDQRGFLRYGAADIGAFEFAGVGVNPPVNLSVSPASGSSAAGTARSFVTRSSDPDGAGDFKAIYFKAANSVDTSVMLCGYYDAIANKVYLRNNANSGWLGGFAPGSSNTISDPDGGGSLNCAGTSVSRSGQVLQVTWSYTRNTRLPGDALLLLYCQDRENHFHGYDQLGTWNLTSGPVNTSVSPNSGSSKVGVGRTLTTVYSDPNGGADVTLAYVLVKGSDPAQLWGDHDGAANLLYLRNRAGTAWLGGFAPGSNLSIRETGGGGTLNCYSTRVTRTSAGLTVNWAVIPSSALVGSRTLSLFCQDSTAKSDGWDVMGAWTIAP